MSISIRVHKIIEVLTAMMLAASLILFLPSPAYAAAAWTVTDANDTAGSAADITLRYAMTHAQSGDTINFADSVTGQCYYTTDGSDPVTSNTRKSYDGLIPVSQTETIKAVNHTSAGWSAVTSATFNIGGTDSPREPMIFPYEGSFTGPQTVYLYGSGADQLFYTTDGTDPGASSTRTSYQGALTSITVSQSETVKVIAQYNSSGSSNVATASFTIGGIGPVTAPVITPNGGSFSSPLMVDIYNRSGTIYLSNTLPKINMDLTIDGPGAENLTISGNFKSRVFEVDGGSVSISGITVENGFARGNPGSDGYNGIAGGGGGGGGAAEGGGGLLVKGGTLTIDGINFLYNQAVGGPGGYGGAGYTGGDDYGDGGSGASSDLLDNSAGGQGGIAPFAAVNFGIFNLSSDRPGSDASDGTHYGGGGGGSGINSDNEPSGYSFGGQGGQDVSGTTGTGPNGGSNDTNGSKGGNGGSGGAANVIGGYYYGGNGGNGGDAYGGAICVIDGYVQILNSSFTGNSVVGGMGGAGGISYQGMSNGQSLDSFICSIGGTLLSGNRGDFESGSLAWFLDFGLSRAGSAFNFETKTSTAYPFGGYPGNGGNGEGGAIYVSPYNGSFGFNDAPVVIVNSTFADNGAYGGLPGPKTAWTGLSGSNGQHSADDIANKTNSAHIAVRNITGADSTLGDITTLSGPSDTYSEITASSLSVAADGTSSTTIKVSLRDFSNMPVLGDRVTLNQGSGHSTISPSYAYTDSDGNAVFTVTDAKAETVAYTVTDETNVTISGNPLQIWDGYQNVASTESTVTYTPGPASADKSTVSVSPSTVPANDIDSATVTVTLEDAGGNPLSGKTVILSGGAGNSSIIPKNNGLTDANGAATFTVTDNRVETVTYTARDTTDNVTITQTATVTFTSHAVNAAQSGVTANPQSVFADGLTSSTITVILKDAYGYPVSGKTVSLNQGTGNSEITPQNNGVTGANGAATFSVTDTKSETVTYTAGDTTDNVTITQTAMVTFTPHDVSASNSDMTVNPGSVIADGLTSSTITVTLRDATGNPVSGKTVSLNQGTGNSTITPQNNGVTNVNGTATFTVTDTRVESVTYTAISDNVTVSRTGDVINSSPAIVNFVPNSLIVSTSDDGSPGTLRYAMQNAPVGSTIYFQSGLTGTITLQSPLPVINRDLTIDGSGANVTISGNSQYRVFLVSGPRVTFKDLTIADGRADGSNNVFGGVGGGLYIFGGTVYIDNVTFNNNNATGGDGTSGGWGWGMSSGGDGGNGWGGAVCLNNGSLTVTNSSFTDNQAVGGSGGPGNYGGNGGNGEGGAVFVVEGSLTVTNSSFTGNNVIGGSGGGGFNSGNPGSALGSGLYNLLGTVVLNDVTHDPGSNSLYNLSTINTVTFDSQGGSPASSISNSSVSIISEPAAPTRTGYSFGGWYKEADYINEWNFSTGTVTGGITLFAKWTIQTQTVTFKDWDGTVLNTETVNYGAGATAPGNPARTGFNFTGWDVDFSNVTSDLTVTAQYSQNSVTYTVTYDGNGGTGTVPTESDKAAGATFSAAAANSFTAPSGKQFKEWNTDAGGTGTSYAAGATVTMPARNLTLYAIWEDIPAVTLSSITITTQLTKVTYTVGDPLDISGMVVTGTYSDNSTKTESITTANVTGFDSSAPAASQVLTVTVGGKTATYTVTINAAPAVPLTTPSGLSWNGTTPGEAEWSAVNNASGYRVQLIKDGSSLGSAVTVTTPSSLTVTTPSAISYDFTSDITTAGSGSYTFTVTAVGDGTHYSNSAASAPSSAYSYTAPFTLTLTTLALSGTIPNLSVGQAVYDLNKLSLSGTDQYGEPFSLSGQTIQWNLASGNTYASISGSTLFPVAAGSGTVTASVNGVTSNSLGFAVMAAPVSAPDLQSVATDSTGTQILLTFNKAMATSGGSSVAFSVSVERNNQPLSERVTQSNLGSNDTQLILSLSQPLLAGDTISISYTPGTLTSADGGLLGAFTDQPVTNKAPQPLPISTGNTAITVSTGQTNLAITSATINSAGSNPISITVPEGVNDTALNVANLIQTSSSGTLTTNALPALNITAAVNLNNSGSTPVNIMVQIPQGTTASAPAGWNGTIQVPTVQASNSVTIPTNGDVTATVNSVIEVGYGNVPLTFSHAVRLLIPGQAGRKAGYVRNGTFYPINTALSADNQSTADNTLGDGQDGYINVGTDMVIWTKHFTQFVTYTETPVNNGGHGGGGSSGGGENDSNSSTSTTVTGRVIDGTTGKPIAGAKVTLYYANTEGNKTNGKTPDTVAALPGIDGFKPNNNQNPQTSDTNGAYGFMVFPDTDYYIVAVKNGYEEYTSPTISVGQEIVHWDFRMSPAITGVNRLAGQSRVDTALAIAKAEYPSEISNVVLATADNYPDALAGSVLAYKFNAPILLVGNSESDQANVLDYMKSNLDRSGTVYILGGTAVVSADMQAKVKAEGFSRITRLGGTDRYDTCVKIADQLKVKSGTPIVLAYGENYPDALSISSIAAENQYPILLVQKDGLSDAVKNEIAAINPSKVYIIGGEGVISSAVESLVEQITSLDKTSIVRIAGEDRYDTSLAVAQYFSLSGQSVCIATGSNFPDALAGSVYAASHNTSIILADGSLSDQVMNYLKGKKLTGAAIFGGEVVVGKGIEQQLIQLIES